MGYYTVYSDELYHYGVLGMKWGVRRYRNTDGSLTNAGKKRVFKTVQKYKKSKDHRASLGKAVGEDADITEAARKVYPLAKKCREVRIRRTALETKMEQTYENEVDRLIKKTGWRDDGSYQKMASETVSKKYGKELDSILKQEEKARSEYREGIKNMVDTYLGKYGDKRISDFDTTAGEAFATQIDWGINLGRLEYEK